MRLKKMLTVSDLHDPNVRCGNYKTEKLFSAAAPDLEVGEEIAALKTFMVFNVNQSYLYLDCKP